MNHLPLWDAKFTDTSIVEISALQTGHEFWTCHSWQQPLVHIIKKPLNRWNDVTRMYNSQFSFALSVWSIRSSSSSNFRLPLITICQQLLLFNYQHCTIHHARLIVGVFERPTLLYKSSSLVSVAYSAFGDSTIASTGQDSWQKPQ